MAPRKTRDIEASLLKKGFRRQITHHKYYWLHVNDRKTTVWTKVSHATREIPDRLASAMARQLKLNRSEFNALIDCPLTKKGYLAILRSKGVLR